MWHFCMSDFVKNEEKEESTNYMQRYTPIRGLCNTGQNHSSVSEQLKNPFKIETTLIQLLGLIAA